MCGRKRLMKVRRCERSDQARMCKTRAQKCTCESGQGTVEFALVTVALLAIVIGISAIWHLVSDGTLMQHVLSSASHHIDGQISALADVFAY